MTLHSFSRHNIFSNIKDSDNYFIVNLLSGNADILEPKEAELVKLLHLGKTCSNPEFVETCIQKGYLVIEEQEKKLYKTRYLDFLDERDNDEVQIFYVLNYSCNFACSYCYQDEYINPVELKNKGNEKDVIDAFFNYLHEKFAGRKKYITLFGGEPLLNSPAQKTLIQYFIEKATEAKLELCVVTNGYTVVDYIDILKKAPIREIQITLDGTADIHNKRRFLKGGGTTFDKIVAGIDVCLDNQLSVNLRVVIDKENITNLPDLARLAIEKGWTKNPLFKTQIGRNYELHHCQSAPDKLFTRVSLYEKLYELVKLYPEILEFHKPAFSISKFLTENGNLPDPLFDSCPACKTEWAFDYTGNIYSCTATVGKLGESLGKYYPQVSNNDTVINEWEMRDVTSIDECKSCNLQLACGGGCGSIAKNKSGKICSPDCRPVKELLELGLAAYSQE